MIGPSLKRTTFTTSRLLEFCSTRELTNLIGHDTHEWPLVVIKELVDNALDAAEEAGVSPCIEIQVSTADRAISVTDNGPGFPEEARERVFHPFFTTKPQGTGLGLALVQKIVVTHNGRVAATRGPGGRIILVFPSRIEPVT